MTTPPNLMHKNLEDGSFDPMLQTEYESPLSRGFKYAVNFILAMIRVFINLPTFVYGVFFVFKEIADSYGPQWFVSLELKWHYFLYAVLVHLLWLRVLMYTRKFITSEKIELIWSFDFLQNFKNPVFSKEVKARYEAAHHQMVHQDMQAKLDAVIEEYEAYKQSLAEQIERLQHTANFPEEFFDAIVRMIDLVTWVVSDPDNPRYYQGVLFDRLLAEICSSKNIPNAHQAALVLVDGQDSESLVIAGAVNQKESVILNRKFKRGEGFAGQVFAEAEEVWIGNLDSPLGEQYGFKRTSKRPYKAIVGFPIKIMDLNGDRTVGVISVHFRETLDFDDIERANIAKLLDVVGHFVIFVLSHQHTIRLGSGIINQRDRSDTEWRDQIAAGKTAEHVEERSSEESKSKPAQAE